MFTRPWCFTSTGPRAFGLEARLDVLPGRFGDADAVRDAGGFDALGRIHRVAPDVVGEFVLADDAGDDRSGVDADPHLPGRQAQLLALPVELGQVIEDPQRAQRGIQRVRAIGFRHAADGEIGIADRLELFQTMSGHDVVEPGEVLVELVDDVRRLHAFDEAGEAGEVDEDHGRRVEEARLNALAGLELLGDGGRQDIQQQPVRFTFLGHGLVARALQFLQHRVALEQLPAQFQVNHRLP